MGQDGVKLPLISVLIINTENILFAFCILGARIFINVFCKRETGFHRRAKHCFKLDFFIRKMFPLRGKTRWAN